MYLYMNMYTYTCACAYQNNFRQFKPVQVANLDSSKHNLFGLWAGFHTMQNLF